MINPHQQITVTSWITPRVSSRRRTACAFAMGVESGVARKYEAADWMMTPPEFSIALWIPSAVGMCLYRGDEWLLPNCDRRDSLSTDKTRDDDDHQEGSTADRSGG